MSSIVLVPMLSLFYCLVVFDLVVKKTYVDWGVSAKKQIRILRRKHFYTLSSSQWGFSFLNFLFAIVTSHIVLLRKYFRYHSRAVERNLSSVTFSDDSNQRLECRPQLKAQFVSPFFFWLFAKSERSSIPSQRNLPGNLSYGFIQSETVFQYF